MREHFLRWKDGYSILHWAAKRGDAELCAWILSLGGDVTLVDANGKNPLAYAQEAGNAETQQVLERAMQRVKRFDLPPDYVKALEAVERKGWDRVRWGDAGFTLLHYAARKGRDDLVAHLLGLGALDAEDSKNTSALGYAQRAGHSSIIALLEPATAPRQVASLLFTAAETYRGRVGGFLAVEHFS